MSSKINETQERWAVKEIIDFLEICKQRNILNSVKNKKNRHEEIFLSVRDDMKKLGYTKTVGQLSLKFKKLRQQYYKAVKDESIRRRFDFFDKFQELDLSVYDFSQKDNMINSQYFENNNVDSIINTHFENNDVASDFDPDLYEEIPYRLSTLTAINDHSYYDQPFPFLSENSPYSITNLTTLTDHSYYDIPQTNFNLNAADKNKDKQLHNTEQSKQEQPSVQENKTTIEKNKTFKTTKTKVKTTKQTENLQKFLKSYQDIQKDLQVSFFREQERLQKQQQKWEEQMMKKEQKFLEKLFLPVTDR